MWKCEQCYGNNCVTLKKQGENGNLQCFIHFIWLPSISVQNAICQYDVLCVLFEDVDFTVDWVEAQSLSMNGTQK